MGAPWTLATCSLLQQLSRASHSPAANLHAFTPSSHPPSHIAEALAKLSDICVEGGREKDRAVNRHEWEYMI